MEDKGLSSGCAIRRKGLILVLVHGEGVSGAKVGWVDGRGGKGEKEEWTKEKKRKEKEKEREKEVM